MGKWAQYQKRGSAGQTYPLTPPVVGDWHLTAPTSTTVHAIRDTTAPPPATGIIGRLRPTAGGAWIFGGLPQPTDYSWSSLITATSYQVQIAWANGSYALSDWSDYKTITTP